MGERIKNMRTNAKNMTQAEFKKLRALLAVAKNQAIVAKVSGRSSATISRIVACEDWQAYREKLTEHSEKNKQAKIGKLQVKPVKTDTWFADMLTESKKHTQLLSAILNGVNRIN